MVISTTKPTSRPKKYVLAAKGGAGKSTLFNLLSSTAAFNKGKCAISLFDIAPANSTLWRYRKRQERRRLWGRRRNAGIPRS